MAEVPKGPGQPEVTGALDKRQLPNMPGLYRDPVSKKYLHVVLPAGADALVRMGWVLVEEGQKLTPSMEAKLSNGTTPEPPDVVNEVQPAALLEDEPKGKKG
jgi:hypothetical protein